MSHSSDEISSSSPLIKYAPPEADMVKAIACARLRASKHVQTAVADLLNISQSEVSRLLVIAKDHKFYDPDPSFIEAHVADPRLILEADKLISKDDDLQEVLLRWAGRGKVPVRCVVFPSVDREDFCLAASGTVTEWIRSSTAIGCMFGTTLSKIIDGIERHQTRGPQRRTRPVSVIPVSGDPLALMNQSQAEYSASALAAKLERILTGAPLPDLPSLNGVPAYIPTRFALNGSKMKVLKEFFQHIRGYEHVFGSEKRSRQQPLISELDTLLTGIGAIFPEGELEDRTGAFIRERELQEDASLVELRDLILGDFCGMLLPRPGIGKTKSQRVNKLNQGWLGIKEDHIQKIVAKSMAGRGPGVIVVADGAEKAEMVREVVARGYVNSLAISSSLAETIKTLAAS